MVDFLRTSGYRYGTFLEYYVHNIWGTVSQSFFYYAVFIKDLGTNDVPIFNVLI